GRVISSPWRAAAPPPWPVSRQQVRQQARAAPAAAKRPCPSPSFRRSSAPRRGLPPSLAAPSRLRPPRHPWPSFPRRRPSRRRSKAPAAAIWPRPRRTSQRSGLRRSMLEASSLLPFLLARWSRGARLTDHALRFLFGWHDELLARLARHHTLIPAQMVMLGP